MISHIYDTIYNAWDARGKFNSKLIHNFTTWNSVFSNWVPKKVQTKFSLHNYAGLNLYNFDIATFQ